MQIDPPGRTGSPVSSACYAPHSALYFRPDGLIHACCVTGFNVGSVIGDRRLSLREIWDGAMLAAQRDALKAGDYSLGCQECEVVETAGGRSAALAHHFDRFADGAPHPFPKMLDLALSSRCNLQCVMCNGSLSSAIRTQREGLPPLPDAYDDRFFEELDEFLPHLERLQFKGGEPFLAPENRRIWDRLIELGLTPEVTVTTNGTVFNDRVEHYVRALRMEPNISVDGMRAETLESIRVGVDAATLWRNIDRFQELSASVGRRITLSYCLVRSNWREVLPFLEEADRRNVNCNVILVNQPAEFDLLRLPHDRLVGVHRDMATLPTRFETSEPQRVWEEVLERIRSQIEHPVELVVRSDVRPSVPVGAAEQSELRAEIVGRRVLEPVVVDAEEGIVVEVHDQPWASWLGAPGWVGRPMDTLGDVIDDEVGPQVTSVLSSGRPGVELVALKIDAPTGTRRLHVHLLLDEGSGRRRAFVVEDLGDRPAE